MGPDRSAAVRPPSRWRRRRILRSRVPLHRRLRQDPAAARHWLLVIVLAWLLASLVGQALERADQARARWGRTSAVWVADQPVRAGAPLAGALRHRRWPAALVPPAAIGEVPAGARAAGPIDAGTAVTGAMVEATVAERRTVAIPVDGARLPVHEGDRVDVWATADPAVAAEGTPATHRVASGARVVSSSDAAVVLAVAPGQVAEVAEAAATASVTLVGGG